MAESKLPEEDQNLNPQDNSKETWKSLGSVISFKPKKTRQSGEKAQAEKNTLSIKRHLQLVKLAGDLAEQTREEAGELGFMSRLLVMVNLPYRDPGKNCKNWHRKNGNVSIDVATGYEDGIPIGIPYGAYPRLILAYIITQIVKSKSPMIFFGNTFNHFFTMIKLKNGGTTQKRVKEQLKRTLSSSFAWTYNTKKRWSRTNIQVSSQSHLWWDEKEQEDDWSSYVRINLDFFNEVMRNAIPLDLRVLSTLKNSPLGLDLYMFIVWRTFKINEPVYISWESVHQQLGTQHCEIKEFTRECKKHIRRILAINTTLQIKFLRGRLCLFPSYPND
jgi:hypothetical protein